MMFRSALLLSLLVLLAWGAEEDDKQRQLQGSPILDPSADCVLADTTGRNFFFNNGDSFGDLTPLPCGSGSDFPCFCDTTEPSKIRCPYCFFPTIDQTFTCARDGGDVTFTDPFNRPRTCDCEFLGGNNFNSNCLNNNNNNNPLPPQQPEPVCTLQNNVDQCAALTEGREYDAGCNCLSFCNGNFVGCCDSNAACQVSCPFGLEGLVAGCTIEPPVTSPPVASPNTVPPVASPVVPPVASPTTVPPVESPTVPPVPTGPTGPTCSFFGQPCEVSTDCCSNRCLVGACTRAGRPNLFRTTLSGTRGGAGGAAKRPPGNNRQLISDKKETKTLRGL